jgi:hypothetical protein
VSAVRAAGSRGLFAGLAGACLAGALLAGCALHHQGHMDKALTALNVAAQQLGLATPDKAGHIQAALKLVQQAIDEVEKGMAYKIQAGDASGAS